MPVLFVLYFLRLRHLSICALCIKKGSCYVIWEVNDRNCIFPLLRGLLQSFTLLNLQGNNREWEEMCCTKVQREARVWTKYHLQPWGLHFLIYTALICMTYKTNYMIWTNKINIWLVSWIRNDINSRWLVRTACLDSAYRTVRQPSDSCIMYAGGNSRKEQHLRQQKHICVITLMMYNALQAQSSNGSHTINHSEKLLEQNANFISQEKCLKKTLVMCSIV